MKELKCSPSKVQTTRFSLDLTLYNLHSSIHSSFIRARIFINHTLSVKRHREQEGQSHSFYPLVEETQQTQEAKYINRSCLKTMIGAMTSISSIWWFRITEPGEGAYGMKRSKQVAEVEMRRKQPFKELGEECSFREEGPASAVSRGT